MKIKAILLSLVIITLASSCSAQQSGLQNAPLRIEYTQWWGDYTLIVAQEAGFFEKHNVQVEPVYYDVFSKAPPELAAGYVDAGLFAIGDVINLSPYAPLKVVAIYDLGGTNDLVATRPIKSVADLRDKPIGVTLGTPYELYVLEMLKAAGMQSSDVRMINVDPEDVPAALGNNIQAGYVWEPYKTQALAIDGNHILASSEQISGLFPDVIVFRESVLQERPEDVKAFLRAWFEAVEYRNENPGKANEMIARVLKLPISEVSGNARILTLEESLALLSNTPPQGMRPLLDTAKLNAEFLLRIGTISSLPDYEAIFTNEFLK